MAIKAKVFKILVQNVMMKLSIRHNAEISLSGAFRFTF